MVGHRDPMTLHPYLDNGGATIAMAHRGFSLDGLENSMPAFEAAIKLGYRYVETDAHGTADAVAVALHDPTLDRTTDATGQVAELPWEVVKRARIAGQEPVPLLEDILGTWPDVKVNIDIKGVSAIEPVAKVIERTGAHDRVCITSFSTPRRLATVALLTKPVATAGGRRESLRFWRSQGNVRFTGAAVRDIDALQVPWRLGRMRLLTSRHVRAAQAHGKHVHVWTVNDPLHMKALLDMGVDGIVSDRADVLKDVLVARGQW